MPDDNLDQTGRLLRLSVDGTISSDHVPLTLHARESLSELGSMSLFIATTDHDAGAGLLGKSVTIDIAFDDEVLRSFYGLVMQVAPGELLSSGYRGVELEIVPKLWLATLNRRCRSFLSQSALDIVTSVAEEYGVSIAVRGGSGSRPSRDYCLQYCESDFDFLSRLLEEEGFHYYFPLDHDNSNLYLIDGLNGSFEIDNEEHGLGQFRNLTSWHSQTSLVPSTSFISGYDFTSAAIVTGSSSGRASQSVSIPGRYETYSSNTIDTPRSDFFSRITMERLEALRESAHGSGAQPKFAPGGRFVAPNKDGTDGNFLVISVEHIASSDGYNLMGGREEYSNSFACVPLDTTLRPVLKTPKPIIRGIQTASVTCDPDSYGRVKVKFHWGDGVESWWVRVAQPWAHNKTGFQFIPRIEDEVVVQFLDGNPERPLIVGSVFNGVKPPFYDLPANKTQSGIRGTDHGEPGAPETLNEMQFEDKSGSEFIKIFAQKDFNRIVVNDDTLTVRNGNRDVTIETGNQTHKISQGNVKMTISQGDQETTLGQGDYTLKIDEGDATTKLGLGDYVLQLETGDHSNKVDSGKSSTQAMTSIELKVGDNSIMIDQSGITIKGMMISIQGSLQTEVKGTMTTVNGDGMLTLKGGVTMIN